MAELFTLAEVQAKLGISRATLYRLIKEGRLRTVHIHRSPRVTERELGAYLASLELRPVR